MCSLLLNRPALETALLQTPFLKCALLTHNKTILIKLNSVVNGNDSNPNDIKQISKDKEIEEEKINSE